MLTYETSSGDFALLLGNSLNELQESQKMLTLTSYLGRARR